MNIIKLSVGFVLSISIALIVIKNYWSIDFNFSDSSVKNEDNVIQNNGNAIVGSGTIINKGISLQEYEESMKRHEQEIRKSLEESNKAIVDQQTNQVDVVSQESIKNGVATNTAEQDGNITLKDKQSIKLQNVQANVSVIFNNLSGKNFAKLTIVPLGKKPVSLPIYNPGQYLEFESKTGSHIATVLSIDFSGKNIAVDISKVN